MNEIQAFKEYLESHLDDLKQRTPDRATEINDLYAKVTLAYEQTLNASLVGTDQITNLTTQLDSLHEDVQRSLDQNDDVASIIDKICTGVGIATKIAGFFINA